MVRRLGLVSVVVGLAGAAFVAGLAATPREVVSAPSTAEVRIGQRTGYFNLPRVMARYYRARNQVRRLNDRRLLMGANLTGLRAMYLDLQARAQACSDPVQREVSGRHLVLLARQIEDRDREVNKALNDMASDIIAEMYREIRETVAELAREHALTAVHAYPGNPATEKAEEMELLLKPPAAHPFYIDPSAEYTDELIRRLNRKFDDDPDGQ